MNPCIEPPSDDIRPHNRNERICHPDIQVQFQRQRREPERWQDNQISEKVNPESYQHIDARFNK